MIYASRGGASRVPNHLSHIGVWLENQQEKSRKKNREGVIIDIYFYLFLLKRRRLFMAKKKTKAKFYAIKDGIGVKDIIVTSWNECSKLVLGYNAVYKSFRTEEEAKNYLGSVDVEKVKEQAKKGMEERKIRKETTRSFSVRLPKEMYKDFEEKCSSMNLDKDKAIFMLIDEWIN